MTYLTTDERRHMAAIFATTTETIEAVEHLVRLRMTDRMATATVGVLPAVAPTVLPPASRPAKTVGGRKERSDAAGSKPGTVTHDILTTVADAGGVYDGTTSELASEAGLGSHATRITTVRQLADRHGLLCYDRHHRTDAVTAIRVTAKGWGRLGRKPAAHPGRGGSYGKQARPAPVETAPVVIDAGPMERRNFNPERVRAGAAGAL